MSKSFWPCCMEMILSLSSLLTKCEESLLLVVVVFQRLRQSLAMPTAMGFPKAGKVWRNKRYLLEEVPIRLFCSTQTTTIALSNEWMRIKVPFSPLFLRVVVHLLTGCLMTPTLGVTFSGSVSRDLLCISDCLAPALTLPSNHLHLGSQKLVKLFGINGVKHPTPQNLEKCEKNGFFCKPILQSCNVNF